MNKFGKIELIKKAWEMLKANKDLFIKLVAVWAVYYILQYLLEHSSIDTSSQGILSLILSVISLVLTLGSFNIILKLIDKKKVELSDLYTYPNLLMKVIKNILAIIVLGFIAVCGLILFVVPGIYILIRCQFFTYYIVDKDAGVIESLKMSWKLTKGGVINLFLYDLLIIIIGILGSIPFGLGLIITTPLTFIATSLLYRKFQPAKS